jgi:phytoene dehydrogenase-like protein
MTHNSIIIIGAGVAGLCTGIYGQMNGYQTRIFEQNSTPGGLVTAWKRQGYVIDPCVHWLVGAGQGIHLHRYWNEIGLLEGRELFNHDCYAVYHGRDGRSLHMYCDPERLEKHLLELSPVDAPAIRGFVDGVRFGILFNPPAMERYEAGAFGWAKIILGMMPLLGDMGKWRKITIGDLAARFQDPLLREGLALMWTPDFSSLFAFNTLGYLYKRQAGYPIGGSLPLARFLANRYEQLGGQVNYRTEVKEILVESDRAVGVQLADGSEIRADVVVSAADGHTTIFEMLEGRYVDADIRRRYQTWKTFHPLIFASAGVNRTFADLPNAVEGNAFDLQRPVRIAGQERTAIAVRINKLDPAFSPTGKTVLTAAFGTDLEYWRPLLADREGYEAEKAAIAKAFVAALEQIWPGISGDIEMVDVATPLTLERFTGNWKASITGWTLSPVQAAVTVSKTLPGLGNFWMVGHWVYPGGGLPSGVSTGREVIWRQCGMDGRRFVVAAS